MPVPPGNSPSNQEKEAWYLTSDLLGLGGGGGEGAVILKVGWEEKLIWKEIILLFNFSVLYLFSDTVSLFRKSLRDLENI